MKKMLLAILLVFVFAESVVGWAGWWKFSVANTENQDLRAEKVKLKKELHETPEVLVYPAAYKAETLSPRCDVVFDRLEFRVRGAIKGEYLGLRLANGEGKPSTREALPEVTVTGKTDFAFDGQSLRELSQEK